LIALEINKKQYGEYHIEYANTLENLSFILESLEEYEEA
jgi:hypothetical protein